jgi:redox-sensing transcriptional repressor
LVVERLMRYYRLLSDSNTKRKGPTVTSAEIAEALDIDPTQVRKDLGSIGIVGMGRVGFERCEVCRSIRASLGFDLEVESVLVGAGRLGSALLTYHGFSRYGLEIVAAFDNDRKLKGRKVAGRVIKPMQALKPFVEKHGIQLAIITTPAKVSQHLADRLVGMGIKAIWNFSPTRLIVPEDVLVRDEHISLGFAEISHHLAQLTEAQQQEES